MRLHSLVCLCMGCFSYSFRLQGAERSSLLDQGIHKQKSLSQSSSESAEVPCASKAVAGMLFAASLRANPEIVRTPSRSSSRHPLRRRKPTCIEAGASETMERLTRNAPFRGASSYIRLQDSATTLNLETSAKTFSFLSDLHNTSFNVSLVSTVHLAEKSYYESVQSEANDRSGTMLPHDRILYELLVDEDLVDVDDSGLKRIRVPKLQPGLDIAESAARFGLATQVGELDYQRDRRWVLADVTRSALRAKEQEIGVRPPVTQVQESLRSLFSSGPRRRGSQISFFRIFVAWLVPAPELALLLDDYIASMNRAVLGPVLAPLANAILSFDLRTASALSFAQTLVSGESLQQASLDSMAKVQWRNARAMKEVDRAIDDGCRNIAIIYGALHMNDLEAKLRSTYKTIGGSDPQWMTAWSIPLTNTQAAGDAKSSNFFLQSFRLFFALLAIDGIDFLATLSEFANGIAYIIDGSGDTDIFEALFILVFYFLRHAALYLALERWVFTWESKRLLVGSTQANG